MKQRFTILMQLLVCLFAGTLPGIAVSDEASRPNIVMIAIDDLNNWVGHLGGPAITPNIDGLASKSFQFLNAYTACPTCNASRVALLTGQRPAATRIFGNNGNFRLMPGGQQRKTLPEFLREHGNYETVEAGKIFHFPRQKGPVPHPVSDPRSWDIQNAQYVGTSGMHHYTNSNNMAYWLGGRTTGSQYYDQFLVWGFSRSYFGALEKKWETGDWKNAEYAGDYLAQHHDKPFFLAVGFGRPHLPFIAPKEHFDIIDSKFPKGVPLPFIPADDLEDLHHSIHSNFTTPVVDRVMSGGQFEKAVRGYLASISFVDAAVGQVVDAVENSQYADNTIIVLFSDHGLQFGQKQRMEKFEVWRTSTQVPLLIHTPRQVVGQRLEQAVSLLDIYPTLTELADLPSNPNNDGASMVGIMNDPSSESLRSAVVNGFNWQFSQRQEYSVAQNGWNYIRRVNGQEELYDHTTDPSEFNNLANTSDYRNRKRNLGKELIRTAIRIGNTDLYLGDIPASGRVRDYRFELPDGAKLNQQATWTTRRFGSVVSNRDFVASSSRIKSVPGRLFATNNDMDIASNSDVLMSTDVRFGGTGVGAGLVFGQTSQNDYYEFILVDGRSLGGTDVILRKWENGTAFHIDQFSAAPDVAYNRTYTLVMERDSATSEVKLKVLDSNKNIYYHKSLPLEITANSRCGISSFYHRRAEFDNFRLLVSPGEGSPGIVNTNQRACDEIYEFENIDTFDDLPISLLSFLDAGWTTERHGMDYGENYDFIVHDGRIESVNGRLIATRDSPTLQDRNQFHVTSQIRFTTGGHRAGVVFGYEDEHNFYQFDLVDGNVYPNNGRDVWFSRWVDGVEQRIFSSNWRPNVEYGKEYTLIVKYDDEEGALDLTVLDEQKQPYITRSFNILLPVDSKFGIGSYYHADADWDFFRIVTGEEVFLLNESCSFLR